MSDYDNNDVNDEVEGNEPVEEEGGAAPGGNRNFLLALGIMGGIFILILLALLIYWFTSRPGGGGAGAQQANIAATNDVIRTANAATALAATQAAGLILTPSITPTATNTRVPPTATNTQVVAQATPSATASTPGASAAGGGGLLTVTPNLQTRTATIVAVLTQSAQQTQTIAAKFKTGTATALPKTGFAEDVGLPGMFGLALGLVLVIVLVRRLRLSPHG